MRIAEVIGNVTLNQCHPSFSGANLRLAIPMSVEEIQNNSAAQGDCLVVWDELGAGVGGRIAVSQGSEAAQPLRPKIAPIDAYCAAILDDLHL